MINSFTGNYHFLSNFFLHSIEYEGIIYPSVEHAYQAAKSLLSSEKIEIASLPTASAAKKRGREVKIREDWDDVKLSIMEDILRKKFSNIALKARLLGTGESELKEGNYWHDNFWGECSCTKCENAPKFNMLGKLLMKIRDDLKTR